MDQKNETVELFQAFEKHELEQRNQAQGYFEWCYYCGGISKA